MELQPRPHLRIGQTEVLADAALLGSGVVQLPDDEVCDELARAALVEVLPSSRPEPIPIHVVVPARVRVATEVLESMRARSGHGPRGEPRRAFGG